MEAISPARLIWLFSVWSVVLPFLTGLILYKYLDRDSRMIFYLVAAAVPPQLLTLPFPHSASLNILYNLYTLVEFTLMWFFIAGRLGRGPLKTISSIPVILFSLLVVFSIVTSGIAIYFNIWVVAANTFYLCWIFLFVLESLENEIRLLDPRLPVFWYISAIILYAPCTIFVFALYSYIENSTNPFIRGLWSIHGIFNTTLYVLFAIGLFQCRKRSL